LQYGAILTSKTDIGHNDSEFMSDNKLFHGLNFNEHAKHIVLHPINWEFSNERHTHKMINLIAGKINHHNLHMQPFTIDDNSPKEFNRLFQLVTPSTRYGSLGYGIQSYCDWGRKIIELKMSLFYTGECQ
jgi:hypothetical protein